MTWQRMQIWKPSASTAHISRHTRQARLPREGAPKASEKAPQNVSPRNEEHQCIGVSRGGKSTKIHAVVDALGNPIHVQLSPGNVNDVTVAQQLLESIQLQPGTTVLADKAYGKWALREYIAERGADFCIPPKINESDPWFVDWSLYKERHLIENFFLKLKEFRRVATRFDKLADRFLAFVLLASVRILLA